MLPHFEVGEQLFRRCTTTEVENPFATISLVDISVNREGPASVRPLCAENDVLRNFSPNPKGEWILGEVAVKLAIMEINGAGTYRFETVLPIGAALPTDSCVLQLVHAIEPCNYAHSAFQLHVNGQEVTFANYKATLGANKYRQFRTQCRFELARMLMKGEIWLPEAA